MQLCGGPPGEEGGGLGRGHRLLGFHVDLRRPGDLHRGDGAFRFPGGDAVPGGCVRPEASDDIATRQGGEVRERADPQVGQGVHHHRRRTEHRFGGEDADRLRGHPRRRRPGGEHSPGEGRPYGGDQVVGDTGDTVRTGTGGGVHQQFHRLLLGTVVAGQRAGGHGEQPGAQRLDGCGDLLQPGEDLLMGGGLGIGVLLGDGQGRADAEGVPCLHADRHTGMPGGPVGCGDPVVVDDRCRGEQVPALRAGDDVHRPVREPQCDGPHSARSSRREDATGCVAGSPRLSRKCTGGCP